MRSSGKELDRFRRPHPANGMSENGSLYGFFVVQQSDITGVVGCDGVDEVRIISSGEHHAGDYGEWEHVSVSLAARCPTWDEMCYVKDMFWMPGECVVQFHPPASEYINYMPYCLHLWKGPQELLLPPSITVGISKRHKRGGLRSTLKRGLRG